MKLVWSADTALKAYLDTVRSCELYYKESSVAAFVSAMAGGFNAQLIVETWSPGGVLETSTGLEIASRHTGGRHVCIVPDQESRKQYVEGMIIAGISPQEVIVGGVNEAMEGLEGIDFLVVDCMRNDSEGIFRVANLGNRGAVLVCKNASSRTVADFRWRKVVHSRSRIVRSVFLPVGKGLDIAHVVAARGSLGSAEGGSRWIKYVDRVSGEQFIIQKEIKKM